MHVWGDLSGRRGARLAAGERGAAEAGAEERSEGGEAVGDADPGPEDPSWESGGVAAESRNLRAGELQVSLKKISGLERRCLGGRASKLATREVGERVILAQIEDIRERT